jgi:TRAP-type C4-dicarboxylate transport system permease small subunit
MQSLAGAQKYLPKRRLSLLLLIANVAAAIRYVYAVSPSWAIPEERAQGVYSVTGEPFVWAGRALPIVAGFGLLNLVWGAYICMKREWRNSYLWLAASVIWLIAVCLDFAHH